MPKRLNYDEVKYFIKSQNYTLLSNTYKNNRQKLKIKCPKDHVFEMKFNHFKDKNQRCPVCAGNQKLTYDYVKEQIEKEGYTLISKTYENSQEKLKISCDKGHIYETSFSVFKKHKCPYCARNKIEGIDYIKEFIESQNYKLLSKEYKNSQTKLIMKCPKDHIFEMNWNCFQRGRRCSICAKNNKRLTINYIKNKIEENNYKLLSKTYENSQEKLKISCPEGHSFEMNWNCFQRGHRCPVCMNQKLTYDYVKEQIEKENYTLLSKEYKNSQTKLEISCDNRHIFYKNWDNFKSGQRCPICIQGQQTSKLEDELYEEIKSIYNGPIERNNRSIFYNESTNRFIEVDYWFPKLKKGIELNGKYWHSKSSVIKRDKMKLNQAKELGIDLMVITDQEIYKNKKEVMKKLYNYLGVLL